MTGRGIDQILPHPSAPEIYEDYLNSALSDLLPNVPPLISRVRSGYAPFRGGLQTRLG